MPPPSSLTVSAMPWLAVTWISTIVVVAGLIYLLVHEVLGKTDPQRLPEVLRALTPLLNGLARALTQLPTELPAEEIPPLGASTEQTGNTSAESDEEAP